MTGLLILAPALLLIVILNLGFFPGERAIARVRGRWQGQHRSARPVAQAAPVSLDLVHQAGRKMAYALAVRPPPHPSFDHA